MNLFSRARKSTNVCADFRKPFLFNLIRSHKGGPLSRGWLKGTTVTCPWHRFRFDLRRACSLTNPAMQLRTYPVQVEDGLLRVDIG